MFQKISSVLSGVPATLIGGFALVLSFLLPRVGISLPADPAWVTVILCGIPLVYLSVWRIIHNPGIQKISSALLITIAMAAAVWIGDLFAAGEVAFIMALGAIGEDKITGRAQKGLHGLLKLTPPQGRRITGNQEEMIPTDQIVPGDIIRVLPGEPVPADGVILTGNTSIDQAILTGESLPADKMPGDTVYCGTVNRFGTIDFRATGTGKDSSLQQMIGLIRQAEQEKAPMARIADRAATWLVPLVTLIALITGIVTRDPVRAVTVLVVFCPCALVLSTPTAIMAAIGQATKHGVIIKSGEALEKMGKIDTIAMDKTGTLTQGCLRVSDVYSHRLSQDALIRLAASAERKSEHPLSKAITAFAKEKGLSLFDPEQFSMETGRGIQATVAGQKVFCGTETYLESLNASISDSIREKLEILRSQGKATVLVSDSHNCLGVLGLSDVIRPQAPQVIYALEKAGMQTVLLTGDGRQAADHFAGLAGIRNVFSQLLPQDKVARIRQLQSENHAVCMVGDGVNDAPALKAADVGIAMGTMGSAIAVETADIALIGDDITRLPYLKRLASATVKTIRLAICLSMCINLAAVALSIAGILNPTTGALVHNVGSCLVVMIAALLYDRKFQ